jgi:integrase
MTIVHHKGSDYWYMSFQFKGKKVFKSTKTTNKALARKIEAKERERMATEHALGRELEQITLLDAYDMNLKSREGTPYHKVLVSIRNPVLFGRKRCNKTKKQVLVHCLDGAMPLQHLRSSDLRRLVEARKREGSADATIKQHVMAIASAWKHCKDLGYMVDESLTFPSFRKPRRDPVYLTAEEEQRLLDSLDPSRYVHGYGYAENRSAQRQQRIQDQYDFVICLLDSGGRYHEITHLDWKDVNLAAGTVTVKLWKTGKVHTIYLSARMKAVLESRSAAKTHAKWVFPNDDRTSHRPYHNGWFQRAVERAGITDKKIRFHKLRSTYASKLVMNGASLFEVQTLLGHSDPQTTMIYAALVPSDVSKKATAILDKLQEQQG